MDYPSWYETISAPLRPPRRAKLLEWADKALVAAIAVSYLCVLTWLAATGDGRLAKAAIVPAATFALVSGLRRIIDRPRPYEAYAIEPLIRKNAHGRSLPSRHVASAVIIACAVSWVAPELAFASIAACVALATIRVVGGVHFPSDVIAAAAFALACGWAGFIALP